MSVWEVGTLVRKGRLALTMPPEEWVRRALALPGIFLLGLSPTSTLEGALLASEQLMGPSTACSWWRRGSQRPAW